MTKTVANRVDGPAGCNQQGTPLSIYPDFSGNTFNSLKGKINKIGNANKTASEGEINYK